MSLVPVSPPADAASSPERFDVVVAGAGYVGLSVAVSIKASAPSLRVLVVDAAPAEVWRRDGRASAIAAAAVRMLERLEVWNAIRAQAEPIREMIVTDSRAGDVVRPTLLTFGGEAGPGEPFAHMVPNTALNGALRARAEALGLEVRSGRAVDGIEEGSAFLAVRFAEGAPVETRLLVAADGVHSTIRGLAGIRTVHQDYGQKGIVCTVRHERPHNGRAEEHFLPAGPFAILPLKHNRSSLVWTESAAEADRLVRADEMVFELELERRFGLKLGAVTLEDKPRAFPLGLTLARDFVRPRLALAGDAAHGIHPIAGQGLNLGFKDAASLAETVVDAARLGRDIGALDTLERYQRWRRFDTLRMGLTTDVLNRLFSNDNGPLRTLRSFGLSVVDRLPFAKNGFVRQASGLTGGAVPRLLQGEPI